MQNLELVKDALEKRNFEVKLFENAQQAKDYLLAVIDPAQTVGFGGSATLSGMGMHETLAQHGNRLFYHGTGSAQDREQAHVDASNADVYLSSANAILTDGRIINIDGHGNRVSALIHGPAKVILVVGKNKIASTYDEAIHRIKTQACPANARRLGRKTPCATLGYCTDCSSPDRMCNGTLILERTPTSHPIEVLLVNEELGY